MTQPVQFVRFTEVARRALRWATEQGVASGQRTIEPLHLLLGLAQEVDGIGHRVLREAGVDGPALQRVVGQQVPPEVPKRSMQRAAEAAQNDEE